MYLHIAHKPCFSHEDISPSIRDCPLFSTSVTSHFSGGCRSDKMKFNTSLLLAAVGGFAFGQDTFEPTDFDIENALLDLGVNVSALPELAPLVERSSLAGCSIAVSSATSHLQQQFAYNYPVQLTQASLQLSDHLTGHLSIRPIYYLILVPTTARTRPILYFQAHQTRPSLGPSPNLPPHPMSLRHQIRRPRRLCWRFLNRRRDHPLP